MTRNSMLVAAIVAALGLGVSLWFALEPAVQQPGPTADAEQPAAGAPAPSTAGTSEPRPAGGEQTAGGTTAPSGGGTAAPSVTPSIDPAGGGSASGSSGQTASSGSTTAPLPAPQPPTFDIVRVEKDGSTVVAGRAPAGSEVTLFDGETAIGTARAGSDGSFAMVLDQPLTPGSRSLSLAARTGDGTTVPSASEVMVVVPDLKAASAAATPAPAPTGTTDAAAGTASTGSATAGETATTESAAAGATTTGESVATASGETAGATGQATASTSGTTTSGAATAEATTSATATAEATTAEVTNAGATGAATATAETTAGGTTGGATADTAAAGETAASGGGESASTQVAAVEPAQPAPAPEPAPQPSSPIVVASSPTGASVVLQVPGDIKDDTLRVEAVDYDLKGQVVVSGRAPAGSAVAIYLDDALLGQVTTGADGRWVYTPDAPVAEGLHRLRADQLAADGSVTARAEIPFSRAGTIELAANEDFVVVQPGNCLWLIARAKYGDGFQYTQIYEANAQQIRDPDLIYPGQIFLVPKIN